MITAKQRHALLVADRTRNAEVIRGVIDTVREENPACTLLDCEMCFRDAAAQTYLVMGEEGKLHIVFGVQAWLDLLVTMDNTKTANNARLLQSNNGPSGEP